MHNINHTPLSHLIIAIALPVIVLFNLDNFQPSEIESAQIDPILKQSIEENANLTDRFIKIAPPAPPVLEKEPVPMAIIWSQVPLKDTLEPVIVSTLEIQECGCAPSPYDLIRMEEVINNEEEYSLFPEPVYIDPYIFDATVYPNPAVSYSTLELDIQRANQFEILLYDLSGKQVQQVYSGYLESGRQKFELELQDLTTGLYIIQVLSTEFQETLKLQKI